MADLGQVREHMEVVGADGAHVGTVDSVEGGRIKLIKADSGSHGDHHHYISGGLVATVEGNKVRLSATGANAALLEEEKGGEGLADRGTLFSAKNLGIGAAVAAGAAAIGAVVYNRRDRSDGDDSRDDREDGPQ